MKSVKKPAKPTEQAVRTDKPTFNASLDGWLFAVHDASSISGAAVAPIFTAFAGSSANYLVVYKTEKELWDGLRKVGITRGFRIKQIVKTQEFVDSIPLAMDDGAPIKIIWNLRDMGGGRTRWDEIQREVN